MKLLPRRRRKVRRRPTRRRHPTHPSLGFTPRAWAKLLFLRDRGETEVGGFGISADDDLLLVSDVALVRQDCSPITVAFHDDAVADFFDRQVDSGMRPEQVGRIWIHTHPGDSPLPSPTDERTFARVFGPCDWAVMMIVARGGATYARLQFNAGPSGSLRIPVEVDFGAPFGPSAPDAWNAEYEANIRGWSSSPWPDNAVEWAAAGWCDAPRRDLADAVLSWFDNEPRDPVFAGPSSHSPPEGLLT